MGARTLFTILPFYQQPTNRLRICIFKMLPFLATRSLILLMMLASKLQAKERRKKPAGWENKNRKPKKRTESESVKQKPRQRVMKMIRKFLQQCTEKRKTSIMEGKAVGGEGVEYN